MQTRETEPQATTPRGGSLSRLAQSVLGNGRWEIAVLAALTMTALLIYLLLLIRDYLQLNYFRNHRHLLNLCRVFRGRRIVNL